MKFLVRIVYKSGHVQDCWFTKFSVEGSIWEWECADPKQRPILLSPQNIESVWQIDKKEF